MNVPGPTPAQWRLFLEVTLCECPRLVLHAAGGLPGQPRTTPQPPQIARPEPVEGSVGPLSGLQALVMVDVEACFELVGGLDLLSALPQLQFVNACDTQLHAASFVAERQRVSQLPEEVVARHA